MPKPVIQSHPEHFARCALVLILGPKGGRINIFYLLADVRAGTVPEWCLHRYKHKYTRLRMLQGLIGFRCCPRETHSLVVKIRWIHGKEKSNSLKHVRSLPKKWGWMAEVVKDRGGSTVTRSCGKDGRRLPKGGVT